MTWWERIKAIPELIESLIYCVGKIFAYFWMMAKERLRAWTGKS